MISISKEESNLSDEIESFPKTDCLVPIRSSVSVVSWNDSDIKEMQQELVNKVEKNILQINDSLSKQSSSNITCYFTYANASQSMTINSPLILMAAELSRPLLMKRTKRKRCVEDENDEAKKRQKTSGRWTPDEHELFLFGLKQYGRDWKAVAKHIPTRSSIQVRSHAQKYFTRTDVHDQADQRKQHHQNQEYSLTNHDTNDSNSLLSEDRTESINNNHRCNLSDVEPVVMVDNKNACSKRCNFHNCHGLSERQWIATALLTLRDLA
jgi:SHAQKYF class myb-like DNA-binding protein